MIIHRCKSLPSKVYDHSSQSPSSTFYQNPMYSEGLGEPYYVVALEGDVKNYHLGFCVRCSEKGSMNQRTFFDYSIHFVNNLLEGQVKDGESVILFLDGHSSRWDISSLVYLIENNVFPSFLPSHMSI